MRQFIYVIRPVRKDFLQTQTQRESGLVLEHFNYLKSLLARKRLVLAGRCDDATFGIIIFEAESETEANLIVQNDPAVKNGVFTAELHAYSVALMRQEEDDR
jgi:uncharacterized protein YciI